MTKFSNISLLRNTTIIDEHEFPLFEYRGLYQKCRNDQQHIEYGCIAVSLEETRLIDDEKRLNLIVASGYVDESSDVTFRNHPESGYFYAYFNFNEF